MHAQDAGLVRHALRALAEVGRATAAPPVGHGLAMGRGGNQFRAAHPGGAANINRTSINRQTYNSIIFRYAVTVNRSVTANGGCCSSHWDPYWGGVAAELAVSAGTVAPGMS